MAIVLHLSDIHFGAIDDVVFAGLDASIRLQKDVDLIAVSGDFTQRARPSQFMGAKAWLDSLGVPWLGVAGNHDVPMLNPFNRFLRPFENYRRHLHDELMPVFDDGKICVVGINSARRVSARFRGFWKDGKIRTSSVEAACRIFESTKSPAKVAVTHHPLRVVDPLHSGDRAVNADFAVEQLRRVGVDAVLYGHLHTPDAHLPEPKVAVATSTGVVPVATPKSADAAEAVGTLPRVDPEKATRPPMMLVMAGTACSHRRRREPNSYNRLTFDHGLSMVQVMNWTGHHFAASKD